MGNIKITLISVLTILGLLLGAIWILMNPKILSEGFDGEDNKFDQYNSKIKLGLGIIIGAIVVLSLIPF